MGRIKKAAGPKHEATLSPALAKFSKTAADIPLQHLPNHLSGLPLTWPFPRGDLYHWISVLNRFDSILEQFIEEYGLHWGPQTKPFGCSLLSKKGTWPDLPVQGSNGLLSEDTLRGTGLGPEGDRELVESILDFSRLLLDNCGNRSLYNSSERLNDLLNTTSLSLLHANLRLAVKLAQRYYSRQRTSINSQHVHSSLLASHYNFDLDKIQKLVYPVSRSQALSKANKSSLSSSASGASGKEKESTRTVPHRGSTHIPSGNDLVALAKETSTQSESSRPSWDVWGNVSFTYYPSEAGESSSKYAQGDSADTSNSFPLASTLSRRPMGSGAQQSSRLNRASAVEDNGGPSTTPLVPKGEELRSRNAITIELPYTKIDNATEHSLLEEYLPDIPQSAKYEFLNKIRAAKAFSDSLITRRQLLAVRILAVTNLAYVYPEAIFLSKVLHQDSDEPKRLQFTYQLAELVHSGGSRSSRTPQHIQTLALGALDALTKHKSKVSDVLSALNVNVNHGVLLYVTRKAVADLAVDEDGADTPESHEWRDALFSLLTSLPLANHRTAETLISAGLLQVFVDILNLRSRAAERVYPKVMQYLDTFMHQVRDAFQGLASARGLEAIANLTNFEVQSAFDSVSRGEGLLAEYKTHMTDYDIPFFQQQTIRSLFKFVNHMLQHGGGNLDRLLRNLIDSPQLLGALRKVLENPRVFGSNIWSGGVNIMGNFVNNEPTSYNVIAEAGLSKAFLESVMANPVNEPSPGRNPPVASASQAEDSMDTDTTGDAQAGTSGQSELHPREIKVARARGEGFATGILPANEAIASIPPAFGAICLNSTGLQLFRSSHAIESLFEIFESPEHIKIMKNDTNLLRLLGGSCDELARHHPALKTSIMSSILAMVTRVAYLCRSKAWSDGVGAKLWVQRQGGDLEIAGGVTSLLGELSSTISANATSKPDSSQATFVNSITLPSGDKLVSGDDDAVPVATSRIPEKEEDKDELTVADYVISVMRFLGGFFENQALCSAFIEGGGAEYVLDFACLPSLSYDFGDHEGSTELALVIHMMAETKAHLVLPSLLSRTLAALRRLRPMYESRGGKSFFEALITRADSSGAANGLSSNSVPSTQFAKDLVMVHIMVRVLHEIYLQHVYPSRPSHATYPFSQVNLGDMYADLVLLLGKLQAACVKNEILLQNSLSDSWKEATRVKGFGLGNSEADEVFGIMPHNLNLDSGEGNPDTSQTSNGTISEVSRARKGSIMREEHKAAFKNVHTLRYLLSSLPSSITSFFLVLGKGIMPKPLRRIDSYQRQSASGVADAIADAIIEQLQVSKSEFNDSVVDLYAYWIVNLASLSQLMIENVAERPHTQCVTMVLLALHRKRGLKVLEEIAQIFHQEVTSSDSSASEGGTDRRLASAYGGLKIILSFFSQVTTSRTIIDSNQTVTMNAASERDRDKPDYFLAAQFLVELRMAVVSVARGMWESQTLVSKAPSSIAKCLVEILKSILEGDGEKGAFRKNDNLPLVSPPEKIIYKVSGDRVRQLTERGFDRSLAKEAVFRCNNALGAAEEYCKSLTEQPRIPRCPVDSTELEKTPSRSHSSPRHENPESSGSNSGPPPPNTDDLPTPILTTDPTSNVVSAILEEFAAGQQAGENAPDAATSASADATTATNGQTSTDSGSGSAMSLGNILNGFDVSSFLDLPSQGSNGVEASPPRIPFGSRTLPSLKQREAARLEDLDAERASIRNDLIARCLDVLNVHYDVTFELSDLIAAAIRSSKAEDFRTDTGTTLVYTLTSLSEVEGDFQSFGKRVAAYAGLTALVLQDNETYKVVKSTLQDTFQSLVGFIKVFPSDSDRPSEESSPWIGQILLIVEKLLSDDAEPPAVKWDFDPSEPDEPIPPLEKEDIIPLEEKIRLFDAIVEILPKIGKDESLALSVSRVLVMLTRHRSIATRLGEKRNLQRLFVMVKQLTNVANERLQSSFMLILRHIVEDEETIRQLMKAEIATIWDSRGRHITNTTEYLRQMYHLAIRAPDIFVEVTGEKIKLTDYQGSQRAQAVTLKRPPFESDIPGGAAADGELGSSAGAEKPSEEQKPLDTVGSLENGEKPILERPKASEIKTPIVEHPDGVIHYLLSQLLSYKDVEDKDTTKPPVAPASSTSGAQSDIEMAGSDVSEGADEPENTAPLPHKKSDKGDKPEFKAEEHPIYVYRCFILQCLTELLSSYNRTKIEFINFSRKADPLATTPSKPRSGVLNYLLNNLIPVGTLEHGDSIAFKKRSVTSSWAIRVVIALCTKTTEVTLSSSRPTMDEEDEPDLHFVRKFVLGHALGTYKEATTSSEPLDIKYSRMMCIADLFDKMLVPGGPSEMASRYSGPCRLLAKIMFEKNFISALTSSIADIDLNFPGSKRAVKYILRLLNKLTQTALALNQTSSISTTSGQTDEDEISSASSVSEAEEREDTPDLYRHSTLGLLEQPSEDPSESESSEEDEEMYDDGYDEEMEYDEGDMGDDGDEGDVVSEDDEPDGTGDTAGFPGEIEVVLGGEEDEDDDDDDDDEDSEDDNETGADEMEFVGEINGDDENASLDGGQHEDEWQSDEDEEDQQEGLDFDIDLADEGGHEPRPPLDVPPFGAFLRVMEETHDNSGGDEMEIGNDGDEGPELDFLGEDGPEEEEDEEEEDEMDDEEVAFEHEFGPGDDPSLSGAGWDWELDDFQPPPRHHGFPHRHSHALPGPWSMMHGGHHGALPIPTYRSHRNQGASRNDDGTNPLLQRSDRAGTGQGNRQGRPEALTDWVHAIDPLSGGTRMTGATVDGPLTLMNAILSTIGRHGDSPPLLFPPGGGPIQVTIGGPGGERLTGLSNRVQAILGGRHGQTSRPRDDPSQAVTFLPVSTISRWQEEARLLFGASYSDKAHHFAPAILRVLVPPAFKELKLRQEREREAERVRKAEEERIAKEEAERRKKEQEEREAKEKAEREAREAAEAEAAAAAAQEAESHGAAAEETGLPHADESAEPMEGVESTDQTSRASVASAEPPAAEAGPSEQAPRIYTTIRGRQLDITDMQIDQEYLEALPEELREEVIMQQLAEQRSQQTAAGEEPSELNAEFLEALPPNIREELLQQEAQERRRRDREANRRRAAENGGPRAEEMDGASFIATLDPALRQAVLADQPDEVLASLGPDFVNEARALTGRHRMAHHFHEMPRLTRDRHRPQHDQAARKPPRRQMVQMLDKAGVATLLRLMFMPLQGSGRQYLNQILHDVCENRQNRNEVVSLLLSILQDGSTDVHAVERSFAQLSLRAKQTGSQKAPQFLKRTLSTADGSTTNADMSPLMVVQQCLSSLVYLTQTNNQMASSFLTPHESSAGLKSFTQRKGKAKEDRTAKYSLNALLTLLDRKLIMDSSSAMDTLTSLLFTITKPLTVILKKEREKADEAKKTEEDKHENDAEGVVSGATPSVENTTSNDQGISVDTTMTEAGVVDPAATSTEHPDSSSAEQASAAERGQAERGEGTTAGEGKADESKKAGHETIKKAKILEPPAVPEHNLRLVANVASARECPSKTFNTLMSVMDHLNAVPGAKEIFGKELLAQAKVLSTSILTDLIELLPNIKEAHTGTEIQGMALVKFSSASSDQYKFLRVLTGIGHLFDPNHVDPTTNESFEIKEQILSSLHETSTFGPLWAKLSECLTAIHQRDNMLNVATILLPLIEALMIVCKTTNSLKEAPRNVREFSVTSPLPDSGGMEGLFYTFTEEHRKILNELVRHNPTLMKGPFDLLVQNPKVLEFDNKRSYFAKRLHDRRSQERPPQPPLQLSVRREQVFLDSFKSLYFKSPDEMKYGKLSIRFHGEEGVDAGGVTREWFQVLARGMFNPNYALFIPVASDRTTFHPNRLSSVNSEHLLFFKFIGRIIGKAIYEGRVLDCHFSRAVYKRILGKAVSIKDMETLDLDYYKSLLWMLENDITDIITETFALETDDFGEKRIIDLIENGRNIPVTEENKHEYVQLVVEYRLTGSVQEQLENFLKGFHDIIPAELISIFNEQELELLISGLPDIDVDDWKNNTEYHNYSAASSQIQWFWRAVRSFDKEERAKLLQFVTGTSKVPLNGFKELEGMNGFSKFNIHRDYGNKDRLPSSHTCFNQLDLPEYESYEQLRQQLYTAMTTGSEYFGFA